MSPGVSLIFGESQREALLGATRQPLEATRGQNRRQWVPQLLVSASQEGEPDGTAH
jgi:hypothetical protein